VPADLFWDGFILIAAFFLGSFLNVCIVRLPQGASVVSLGSHCPRCKQPIAWFDNVPLLSFIFLRGKCRHCKGKISVRYPLVEIAAALIWFGAWKAYGVTLLFGITAIYLSLLLVVSLTDIETGTLPDRVTYFGLGCGVLASLLAPSLHATTAPASALWKSLIGAAVGGALIFVTGWIGSWIFQREAMGGGDVKLLAMIGSFIGWEKVLIAFFIAPVLALPFALYQRLARQEEVIFYGPFLALAGGVQFFYGDLFWRLFIGL
jgi:leader peptidase (prepilin peptidase)/N-methyltransferase